MGYYTGYTVTILDKNLHHVEDDDTDLAMFNLEEISGYSFDNYYLHAKWYEYTKDMLHLSTLYPGFIFQLTGTGESEGDYWRAWYQNGTTYTVNAEMPEFDKDQMQ